MKSYFLKSLRLLIAVLVVTSGVTLANAKPSAVFAKDRKTDDYSRVLWEETYPQGTVQIWEMFDEPGEYSYEFCTRSESAIEGEDFDRKCGTRNVTITPNDAGRNVAHFIAFGIINDSRVEATESLVFEITATTNFDWFGPTEFTFYIISGDRPVGGDANGDGVVDFADFLLLSSNFGQILPTVDKGSNGDLDQNGKINFADFLILSAEFGNTY